MTAPIPTIGTNVARGSRRLRMLLRHVRQAELTRRVGSVRRIRGLAIEADGPRCHVGELCAIVPHGDAVPVDLERWMRDGAIGPNVPGSLSEEPLATGPQQRALLAEVVAIEPGRVTLMPYGGMQGLAIGASVVAMGDQSKVGVGDALLGRVIDALGRPLDGLPPPATNGSMPLEGVPRNPMHRPRISAVLETGIRSIDALLTLGRGQRVGIFSGSGVGKSTLLGMIARHVDADINVIALIGERGREVRDFIDKRLGVEGLKRSVVVVASADQPAPARIRAAYAALAIAEHFCAQGKQVLLTMDSITRLAMARREIGLSAGEPPTARGYTPSVFAELPGLCERCGTAPSGGAITAILTVLVEGDDLNEPVSDALRAILDGHIVLSRHLAHQGQYPAIDVLKSTSRLLTDLTSEKERTTIDAAIRTLALLERNRQLVELGAYESGSNLELDAALECQAALTLWLRQVEGGIPRTEALAQLRQWHDDLSARQSRPGSSSVKTDGKAATTPTRRPLPAASGSGPRIAAVGSTAPMAGGRAS